MTTETKIQHDQFHEHVLGLVNDLERLVAIANGDELTHEDWTFAVAEGVEVGAIEAPALELDDDDAETLREAVREHLYQLPLDITEHATRSVGCEWEHSHSVILFATGGPGIELNTQTMLMDGYWWGDRVSIPCNSTVADFYIGDTY